MTQKQKVEKQGKTTIADIARESDVSPATVSLVLRDKPGVGSQTRQRVLDTARALGYISPSGANVETLQVASKRIGLVIKTQPNDLPATNQFYAPVMSGIESVCRQNRSNLLYANMLVDEESSPLEIPYLISNDDEIDGLLMVGIDLRGDLLNHLQHRQIPLVLVDSYAEGDQYDTVITDNSMGGEMATRHLINQGHTHIALVGSRPSSFPSILERRIGYTQAMRDAGLDPIFWDSDLVADDAADTVEAMFNQSQPITAIFACNDEIAIAVIRRLEHLGLDVPADVSVIGFDNILLAQHVTPALTTIRVDKVGMGRMAAQLMFNRLEFPESSLVQAFIKPQLRLRESTTSKFT